MDERPPVLIGERVLWLGSGSGLPKSGKVKWIGRLPEIGPDWAVGLELDEALPYGGIDGTWGNRKLFVCRHKHGLIVPLSSVIPQPKHIKPGELFGGEPFGRTLRSSGRSESQELAELAPPKPESKVGKLFRAFSQDESSHRHKYDDLELPSTHLRNPNLERQLAILGTLRRSNLLESARLEGVKSEACLYSVVLEKEENVFRERRRMIQGREFKRSDDTLDRTSSVHSSRSSGSRRERTSGIFSFFRWFKREKSEDSGEDSPPSPNSPVLRRANGSISGSVDTLFSTATTRSFAFVQPSHYRPYGAANPPEIRICPGPETNTYRNRIRQRDLLRQKEQNISLREKYRLYASETLPRSVDRINEISGTQNTDSPSGSKNSTIRRQKRPAPPPPVVKSNSTSENSLPITLANEANDHDVGRQHRRTLSEPSPTRYVKACHVKGKRKAPPPPNNSNKIAQSSPSDRTLSLQRKKRRAPPPPIQRSPSDEITEILQRAFEDITGSDSSLNHLETVSNASTVDISQAGIVATDTLRLERGYLKPNKEERPMELKYKPTSPVSPRPWYKRNAATRENSFSRSSERKKEREKRRVEDWMIESGIPRRPNHLPESRFNVFAKMDKAEEKRRSQISILTNISELDREAAEIVQKNKEKQQAILANQNDRFYDGGNGATSNGYFNNTDHNQTTNAAEHLATLLNSITNVTNVTVNSAFYLQDSNFRGQEPRARDNMVHRVVLDEQEIRIVDNGSNPNPIVTEPDPEPGPSGVGKITKVTIEELDDFDKERNSRAQAMYEANRLQRLQSHFIPMIAEVSESAVTSPASTVANTPSEPIAPPIPGTSASVIPPAEQSKALQRVPVQLPSSALKPVVHVVWNCPRCTLENPRWKITCEACDMWRPVPCEFKEVKPKHPLPLAVLRIVEPKDQKRPSSIEIIELKDEEPANNVPLTNGNGNKSDEQNDGRDTNLNMNDNKIKRSSQGLTISDLLFNTQSNSTPKDNNWYKDILNGLNLPPSTTTYKEYTNNLQKKQEQCDKPLNTTKLPPNGNVPTPSASGSSISSLSSTNSEKLSTPSAVQSSPKKDIVEPEEIRKARLAFFEKYGKPSTSQAKQTNNLSSESKIKDDETNTRQQGKINETPKLSTSRTTTPVMEKKEDSKIQSYLQWIAKRRNQKITK
ncbi:hypothetical protein GE061_010154 [Apolygus lucorum]|uniref:RanBP2-type domain-containing protein n=1 Tax=Apolygus lucorum TaxID=248454 RepID=A0A8S9Y289_APOLU|nr:hypothetical protein GE061_010154 [Apolygus lucorum]